MAERVALQRDGRSPRALSSGTLRDRPNLDTFMNEAGAIGGKGGPPMSPDFTDAVLAPARRLARALRFSPYPTTCAMFANASLKALAGASPLVSTLVSEVSMSLWICVSYGPIGCCFSFDAEAPKIWPIGALLK